MAAWKPCCYLRGIFPNKCTCPLPPRRSSEELRRKRISAELERRIREAFKILDRDYDELIRKYQLGTVLRMAGMNPMDVEWVDLIEDTDVTVEDCIEVATVRWNDDSIERSAHAAFAYYEMETFQTRRGIKRILRDLGVADIEDNVVDAMVKEASGDLVMLEDLTEKFWRGFWS